MAINLSLRLPADPRAAAGARRSLGVLGSYFEPTLVEELELLVSELVTNSLRHGGLRPGSWIELCVEAGDVLRVRVTDPGRGFAHKPVGGEEGTSGWGLLLVDRLADRWGASSDHETRVWFEIDVPRGARRGT
jgi:anti-sigma regulatory factor (Ser/Thr protein kinase)